MTAAGPQPTPDSSRLAYGTALWLAAAFTCLHALALPVLVTWDGHVYAELADVLFSPRFPRDWDFLRTPLYPFALKLAFWTLGRQPLAVTALGGVLAFTGIWAAASAIRDAGHPRAAACWAVLVAVHPMLVTYQHSLLTEVGTFCALALLVKALLRAPDARWRHAFVLAGLVVAGYAVRPTLLYLAPLVALLDLAALIPAGVRTLRDTIRTSWRALAGRAAIVAMLPFLVAAPWNRSLDRSGRAGDVWLLGLSKQAIFPPGAPDLGSAKDVYAEAVAASMVGGRLDIGGMPAGPQLRVHRALQAIYAGQEGAIFRKEAIAHPARYLSGVGRTLLVFLGVPPILESENRLYQNAVLTSSQSVLYSGPPDLEPAVRRDFAQHTGHSAVAGLLKGLAPLFDVFVFLGSCLALLGLAVGILKRDLVLLVLGAIHAGFALLHAAALLSLDRYGVPIYPLALATLILVPLRLANRLQRDRASAQAPEPALGERRVFAALGCFIGLVALGHLAYLLLSGITPSWDEAHYMSGALRIERGIRGGMPAAAWDAYAGSLGTKPPLLSLAAALVGLVLGEGVRSFMLSLVPIFVALGFASWSLFRNVLPPRGAAIAAALLCTAPMVTGLTHRFYVENLLLLLLVLYFDVLLRHGWESPRWSTLSGVILGLAVLTKPTALPLAFLPSLYLLLEKLRKPGTRITPSHLLRLAARSVVMVGVALAVAWTWYGRNWRSVIEHSREAFSLPACAYPDVSAFLADVSSGPHLFVFVLAVAGLFIVIPRLCATGMERGALRGWMVLLLLGAATFLMTTLAVNKMTRLSETWLPTFSALAAATLTVKPGVRHPWLAGAGAVGASFLLFLHNSFGVLPLPALHLGDLKILDDSFPLNIPDWFEDNHPVDRRAWRLQEAAQAIATDAAANLGPAVQVQVPVTVDALLLSNDTMTLIAELGRRPVSFLPWRGTDPARPDGPPYLLHATNLRPLYPGRQFSEYAPALEADAAAGRIPYEVIARIPEPAGAEVIVLRKRALAARDALILEAENFTRGNAAVDQATYGRGIGVIVSRVMPTFVEYEVQAKATDYQIDLRCASAEARPLTLTVNGTLATSHACDAPTGSWGPDGQAWRAAATVRLRTGVNLLRLERLAGPFPHVDKLRLVPMTPSMAKRP